MGTLLIAVERPLGIVAQHVHLIEFSRLVVLVEVRHIALAHLLNRRWSLCHLQIGLRRTAGDGDIGHTRFLGGITCHLEGEFL